MARVVIEHLTKFFRGPDGESLRALNDLSLRIEDKELLVLVGPSGCGKTTALRLIAGLDEPTSGTICLDGRVLDNVPAKDRDIAMVFQNPALYPHLSVSENMAFGLMLRHCPKAEIARRVGEAAEMLGLADCLERKPMALSGGQRQRVALGRAIVRRPRLFLFDEPLSNLDPQMRVQMRAEIARLHARLGTTMLYVTHDQAEAMTLGNRLAVIKEGMLQQLDTPLNLYRHPANIFVAGFIGSPPMNFFDGSVEQKEGALFFRQHTGPAAGGPDGLARIFHTRHEMPTGRSADFSRLGKPVCAKPTEVGAPTREGELSGLRLRVDDPMAERLSRYPGTNLVLGLRPEHIALGVSLPEAAPDCTIEATVDAVEPLGAETYLHATAGAQSFVVRVSATEPVSVNQRIWLVFDMRQAHFFDPATGKRVI